MMDAYTTTLDRSKILQLQEAPSAWEIERHLLSLMNQEGPRTLLRLMI